MIQADLAIIGAGSGGLTVAAVAAQLGLRVTLIEKNKMGGDCLNTGCVPSKALLAAAHCAQTVRQAAVFGIQVDTPQVDFQRVHDYIQDVIRRLAPHDSKERFEALGVRVMLGQATFEDANTLRVNGERIRARYTVIATGATARVLPIPGLEAVPYLTNETLFTLTEKPAHLIVIGGGPIGCEVAQAYAALGAKVTLLEKMEILPQDDRDLVGMLRASLKQSGVELREGCNITRVAQRPEGIGIFLQDGAREVELIGSHLLLAVGRVPQVGGLSLEKAGVVATPRGIQVDARLRTTCSHIYALGDVIQQYPFTHAASYQAGIVIRNIVFRLPARVQYHAMPWVTYTDPELAQVGLTEAKAHAQGLDYRALQVPFSDNDRAQAEHQTQGALKVILDRRSRVLGASVLGARAGELLLPWILAVQKKIKFKDLAALVVPYPTFSEIHKKLVNQQIATKLYSPFVKKLVRGLHWIRFTRR